MTGSGIFARAMRAAFLRLKSSCFKLRIRGGVKPGTLCDRVVAKLGLPNRVHVHPSGSERWEYPLGRVRNWDFAHWILIRDDTAVATGWQWVRVQENHVTKE